MKWHLDPQHAPDKIEFLENRAIQTGRVAQALQNRPELSDRLHPYWETFWVLHPSRPVGMAAGAITIDSIVSYLRLLGYRSSNELLRGVRLVSALDNEWRQWNDAKNSKG